MMSDVVEVLAIKPTLGKLAASEVILVTCWDCEGTAMGRKVNTVISKLGTNVKVIP